MFHIRGRSHIMSAAEGGEGGSKNLTYADTNFRGLKALRQLVMSANAKNQNYDFLNCHENTD